MATSFKTCYWCLHVCHRKRKAFKHRSIVTCAQPSNGTEGGRTATVEVELDRSPSRDLEQQLDDATLPNISSQDVYDDSSAQSWPLSEISKPPVLKAVAVEFMAQVDYSFGVNQLCGSAFSHSASQLQSTIVNMCIMNFISFLLMIC